MTRVRIGYPYACSNPQEVRESVVILYPSDYPGFNDISVNGKIYEVVNTDTASHILNSLSKGVCGKLIEAQDERKSIARRGRVIGQGSSMQLALVLSVFSSKNICKTAPLILLSAAIDHPEGAPAFIDAKITTYCSEKVALQSLLYKYEAAKFAQSVALILPTRDAEMLADSLQKPFFPLMFLQKLLKKESSFPAIVAIQENELPKLAKILGISTYHYKKKARSYNIAAIFLCVLCAFSLMIFAIKKDSFSQYTAKEMFDLGLRYQKGEGLPQDLPKAIYWIEKAAHLEYPKAMLSLGTNYYKGIAVAKDCEKAIYWYKKIAKNNNIEAMFLLASVYFRGSKPDYVKSFYWYQKAAKLNHCTSMHVLAYMYYKGKGVAPNALLAKKWAEKAASLGYKKAPKLLKIIKESDEFKK